MTELWFQIIYNSHNSPILAASHSHLYQIFKNASKSFWTSEEAKTLLYEYFDSFEENKVEFDWRHSFLVRFPVHRTENEWRQSKSCYNQNQDVKSKKS